MKTQLINTQIDLSTHWLEQVGNYMPKTINSQSPCGTITLTELKWVDINQVDILYTNDDNTNCQFVRSGEYREDKVQDLIKSIKQSGYKYSMGTVIVEKINNVYIVRDGHHRFEAYKRLGFKFIAIAVVKINIKSTSVRSFVNYKHIDKNDFKKVLLSQEVLNNFNFNENKMKKIVFALEKEFGFENSYKHLKKSECFSLVSNYGNSYLKKEMKKRNVTFENDVIHTVINYTENIANYVTREIDTAIKKYHEDGSLTIIHFMFTTEHNIRKNEKLQFTKMQKKIIADLDDIFKTRYSLCDNVKFPFLFGTFVNQNKKLKTSYQAINSELSDFFIGFNKN